MSVLPEDFNLVRPAATGSILLNEDVVWDLSVNTGAVNLDMDLADLMVDNLKFTGSRGY